jgi:coenzyme F420-reducing hydrogenase delta subunit
VRRKHAIPGVAILVGGPQGKDCRYQTGIRAAQTREVPIARHLSDLLLPLLRGQDLNQRPLGYERSRQIT